ncbi:MAG: M3 family oligoendopeptidase [Fibrobacterales bacterium]
MAKDNLAHIARPAKEFPRTFVDASFSLSEWSDILPYYEKLLAQSVDTVATFKTWAQNRSELESCYLEEGTRRYINMTCYTEDPDNAALYTTLIEELDPEFVLYSNKLDKKMLNSPVINHSDLTEYQNWVRSVTTQNELFKEENIAIETEIGLEVQKYQKVTGGMSVIYDGEEKTLQQVLALLNEPNRSIREKAWRLVAARRLQDKEVLNTHFNYMLERRLKVAHNCGCSDYLEYIFKAKERYDYTPHDCEQFHQSIKEVVVPIKSNSAEERKKLLKLDTLRPWDTSCDPLGRPALKPFTTPQELINKTYTIFNTIDSELGAIFGLMRDRKLLDLDSRLGKAPGGYQCGLDEQRLPFIFMNAVGTSSDVNTLLHEGGHSFHQFFMKQLDLLSFREIGSEIAEVASMSMELIGGEYLSEFYNSDELKRARINHFEGVVEVLAWVAIVDSFQHWIYTTPNHTNEERNQKWVSILRDFKPEVDWSDLTNEEAYFWHKQLHIFEVPFYYIEYGIAQIGALQVYKNFKENPTQALTAYKNGLSLGSTKPLPELFEAMNIKFDFSKETIEPLMQLVVEEISALKS